MITCALSQKTNNQKKKNHIIVTFFGLLQITHPAGCMSQFIQFFGEQIMVLWKFALLRKRVLIFSPPPVGVVCYRGERLKRTCLNTHTVAQIQTTAQNVIKVKVFKPKFSVFFCSLSVLLLLPGQCLFTCNWCLCP